MQDKPWYRNYDPGVNLSPEYTTLPLKEQFLAWVKRQPDRPFMYYTDQVITYKQANDSACKLANALLDYGVKKGDRVAIALPNLPEYVISAHACLKIGAVIVQTNPRYTKHELAYQYKDSGTETIICLDQYASSNIEIIQNEGQFIKRVIIINRAGHDNRILQDDRILYYDDLILNYPSNEPKTDVYLEDLAMLQYTGGTTGVSKGCCITNANLIAIASGWQQMSQYFTDLANYKILSATPMYHVHGFQVTINANILLGGSIIILPEITVDNLIEAINSHEPNVWPAVPSQIKEILNHPDLTKSKISKIQHVGSGSAPIPKTVLTEFESKTGVTIIEGYGASETSMAVVSNPILKRKAGSVGIPYPNVDFKVVDIETGNTKLPIGEVGELCFKGPQIVSQYWDHPEDSAHAFRDSWWYSGDVGYMDEDGFLFLVDRKKDMIICSGFKVFSNEVDEILNSHPKISEGAVVGVPDAKRGETVKAYVVLKEGEEMSEAEVKAFCRQYLTAYKVPTEIEFIDKLPRTSVHKLDRKALRLLDKVKRNI